MTEENVPGSKYVNVLADNNNNNNNNNNNVSGDPAEIRTEHLPNTRLERYV
jgi:hypothetical protein